MSISHCTASGVGAMLAKPAAAALSADTIVDPGIESSTLLRRGVIRIFIRRYSASTPGNTLKKCVAKLPSAIAPPAVARKFTLLRPISPLKTSSCSKVDGTFHVRNQRLSFRGTQTLADDYASCYPTPSRGRDQQHLPARQTAPPLSESETSILCTRVLRFFSLRRHSICENLYNWDASSDAVRHIAN